MNTFSEISKLIETITNNLPQDLFDKSTSNAKAATEECLILMSALNKAAYYTEHEEHGDQSLSELAEANAILSELGGLMMKIQVESPLVC